LFNTIVTSTIWQEDDTTRIVWITMLAIADADGKVSAAIPGLASVANVSVEDCENSIGKLKSPDSYSRTKDFEGRRIEETDGGWNILNYLKYRRMMSEEERREYKRIKQAQYRARERGQSVDKRSTDVDSRSRKLKKLTQAEGEADTEAKELLANARFQKAWNDWEQHRKEKKSSITPTARKQQLSLCAKIGVDRAVAAIEFSTMNGYSGLFEPNQKKGVRPVPESHKKVDPASIPIPERFKSWVAEVYPEKREEAMKWTTWADAPSWLRREWKSEAIGTLANEDSSPRT